MENQYGFINMGRFFDEGSQAQMQDDMQSVYSGDIPNFISLLYSTLLMMSPVRTGKMKSNITLVFYGQPQPDGTVAKIIISPGVDYARYTNENSHGPKQQYNYHWVDRSVSQAAMIIAEGNVSYEQL